MKFRATNSGGIYNNKSPWSARHDSLTGSGISTDTTSYYEVGGQYVFLSSIFSLFRGFYEFDTSSLGGDFNITSARLWIYGYTSTGSGIILQKGLQHNPLILSDYSTFTGAGFGFQTFINNQWNELLFDSVGIAAINKTGSSLFVSREYGHDYLNVSSSSDFSNSSYTANSYSHKPILEINTDSELDTKYSGRLKYYDGVDTVTLASLTIPETDNQVDSLLRIYGADDEIWIIQNSEALHQTLYSPTTGAEYLPHNSYYGNYKYQQIYVTGASASIEDDANCIDLKRLNIATTTVGADRVYYRHREGINTLTPIQNISNSLGYTVETRLRIIDSGTGASGIYIYDGTYYWTIRFAKFGCYILDSVASGSNSYSFDTTDTYHIYKINVKNNSFNVFVDDVLRINTTLYYTNTSDPEIAWGDVSTTVGYGGITYYDYIKYNNNKVLAFADNDLHIRTLLM